MSSPKPISYNRKQAAELTGVSVATIDKAIKAGDLRSLSPKIDRKTVAVVLVAHDELLRWIGLTS